MRNVGKLAAGAASAVVVFLLGTGVAFAAGSGYGAPPAAPGGTGAFSTVVAVKDISGATGGTATATVDGASITFDIPAGDFTGTVQAVFSAGDLAAIGTGGFGGTAVTAFGVQVDQNGHKLAGPFSKPLTATVTDGAITASSVVYVGSNGTFTPASGWTTSAGKATGSFSVDPDFLVDTPAVPATPVGVAIPGATTATTGKPFFGEAIGAALLALLGAFGARRWRRQRRLAA
jgi:hypothetical protein